VTRHGPGRSSPPGVTSKKEVHWNMCPLPLESQFSTHHPIRRDIKKSHRTFPCAVLRFSVFARNLMVLKTAVPACLPIQKVKTTPRHPHGFAVPRSCISLQDVFATSKNRDNTVPCVGRCESSLSVKKPWRQAMVWCLPSDHLLTSLLKDDGCQVCCLRLFAVGI
jgi:hypothetical protein